MLIGLRQLLRREVTVRKGPRRWSLLILPILIFFCSWGHGFRP